MSALTEEEAMLAESMAAEWKDPSHYLNELGRHPHLVVNKKRGGNNTPTHSVDGCWACHNCSNINYPRRNYCHMCNESRNEENTLVVRDYVKLLIIQRMQQGIPAVKPGQNNGRKQSRNQNSNKHNKQRQTRHHNNKGKNSDVHQQYLQEQNKRHSVRLQYPMGMYMPVAGMAQGMTQSAAPNMFMGMQHHTHTPHLHQQQFQVPHHHEGGHIPNPAFPSYQHPQYQYSQQQQQQHQQLHHQEYQSMAHYHHHHQQQQHQQPQRPEFQMGLSPAPYLQIHPNQQSHEIAQPQQLQQQSSSNIDFESVENSYQMHHMNSPDALSSYPTNSVRDNGSIDPSLGELSPKTRPATVHLSSYPLSPKISVSSRPPALAPRPKSTNDGMHNALSIKEHLITQKEIEPEPEIERNPTRSSAGSHGTVSKRMSQDLHSLLDQMLTGDSRPLSIAEPQEVTSNLHRLNRYAQADNQGWLEKLMEKDERLMVSTDPKDDSMLSLEDRLRLLQVSRSRPTSLPSNIRSPNKFDDEKESFGIEEEEELTTTQSSICSVSEDQKSKEAEAVNVALNVDSAPIVPPRPKH
eukprot:TRINITY_DN1338_c5_g1_i1.p1 TRINITY_DN1338_c5_g1~~TRINITY_DN1338_c5_g1_i1.p1  ORF type:complete len:576 (+),score=159.41 TRINITY_DN1338_c5_g1_i1:147-1874(+)